MFGRSRRERELEAELESLKGELKTLKASVREASDSSGEEERHDRSAYKSVWTQLSADYEKAVAHVIGPVEEAEILKAADDTVRVLEDTVGISSSDTILEIGCGIGRVGQALAPRCAKWIGCDVSANMLEFAKDRLKPFSNVELHEISGYDLKPIPDASVDLVYCTVVFMHIEEWDRYNYVEEAGRILRPGGRILLDNFSIVTQPGWDMFEQLRKFPPENRPAHISKSSTAEELDAYLVRAGFQSIESRYEDLWVRAWGRKGEQ